MIHYDMPNSPKNWMKVTFVGYNVVFIEYSML